MHGACVLHGAVGCMVQCARFCVLHGARRGVRCDRCLAVADFEIDLMAPLDVDAFDKPWSFFKKPFINTTIFPRYLPQVPLTRVLQVRLPCLPFSPHGSSRSSPPWPPDGIAQSHLRADTHQCCTVGR